VFVSYARVDLPRVAPLVQILETCGFRVWWDQALDVGGQWRRQIAVALEDSGCVIVVWTENSVRSDATFVHDEAAKGQRRGLLLPVRLDDVSPPLGFGEIQAIDLTHWKGDRRDASLTNLCAAVAAVLDGRPAPAAKLPPIVRRTMYGGLVTLLGVALIVGLNPFGVQEAACGAPLFHPYLSDACGALGLGHRPARAEREAWRTVDLRNCAAIREHLQQFPGGAYRERAASLIAARKLVNRDEWRPITQHLVLNVLPGERTYRDQTSAQAASLARAAEDAADLCRGFLASSNYKLEASAASVRRWDCTRVSGGATCGFVGDAVCTLQQRHTVQEERCGG